MQNSWSNVWIRVAVNKKRIRTEGDVLHWRIFIQRKQEIEIRTYEVRGISTKANFVPGSDPTEKNPLGLIAWLDYFGNVEIRDDVAYIKL